jgi:two-component system, sensor histidine kinase and response regulator
LQFLDEATAKADGKAEVRTVRILLAEDNPINQEVMSVWLRGQGHQVVVVPTGVDAMTALEAGPFDVVLMDLQMPIMDGVRATRLIRAREKSVGGRTPIIAVTANALQGERQRCLAAGMDDYLTKPVRLEELQNVIARVTGTRIDIPAASGEGCDWVESLGKLGMDRASTVRLARVFLESAPPRISSLQRALAEHDYPTLSTAAHALKGSLRVFRAEHAVAAAEQVESLGRQARPEGTAEALADLEAALAPLTAELEKYVQAHGG